MRDVAVDHEPLNAGGGAIPSGDDVQRSPGYSGFTFAIGVTPAAGDMLPLNTSGYANPTYIGMNANGEEIFQGKLSRPLLLNERVVPDKDGHITGNGISGVPHTCPTPQTGV